MPERTLQFGRAGIAARPGDSLLAATRRASKNIESICDGRGMTGMALYELPTEQSPGLGWELNVELSGHRLSDFPRAPIYDGRWRTWISNTPRCSGCRRARQNVQKRTADLRLLPRSISTIRIQYMPGVKIRRFRGEEQQRAGKVLGLA